jgi:hypothetical protein
MRGNVSSLTFNTREGGASVSGLERRKFSAVLTDLAWRALERDLDVHELTGPSLLRHAVVLPEWVVNTRGTEFARTVKLVCAGGAGEEQVNLPGRDNVANVLEVHLNTVVANNSDPVALAVRLVAQASCNAWVDGADRKWLADLIEQGRTTWYPPEIAADASAFATKPLFDQEPSVNGSYEGWDAVVELLRADDGIVVLTDSHSDGFPGRIWAAREGELRDDFRTWWQQATPEEMWDRSEAGLREETSLNCPVLRICPDNLHARLFGRDRSSNPTWYQVATAWRAA